MEFDDVIDEILSSLTTEERLFYNEVYVNFLKEHDQNHKADNHAFLVITLHRLLKLLNLKGLEMNEIKNVADQIE